MTTREEVELIRRMKFHEVRKDNLEIPQYWRKKSEEAYWHYLDLLTRPDEN